MDYLNTAEVLRILLFVFGIALTLLCMQMTFQALFPDFVRRCQNIYARPAKVTFVGILCWGAVAIISVVSGKLGPLAAVGVIAGVIALIASVAGSTGLARRIGSGLQSPVDKDQPWRRTLRGGWVMLGLNLTPFMNILGLFLMLVCGLGVAFLAWREISKEKNNDIDDDGDAYEAATAKL
jgi:sugar phosphate permease